MASEAAAPEPCELLFDLLDHGKITAADFDLLCSSLKDVHTSPVTQLSGPVTLYALVPRHRLEACHKVFTTVELLENILKQLDPMTILLTARRVCKHFRDTIVSSVTLRDITFLPINREDSKSAVKKLTGYRQQPKDIKWSPYLQHMGAEFIFDERYEHQKRWRIKAKGGMMLQLAKAAAIHNTLLDPLPPSSLYLDVGVQ
jgi:hypothetical protein